MRHRVTRLAGLFTAILLTVASAGCGSDSVSTPTAPSNQPAAPVPITIHDTLRSADDRSEPPGFRESNTYIDSANIPIETWRVFDDFISSTAATVTTIQWQGEYCDSRFLRPPAVPGAAAASFHIWVSPDSTPPPAARILNLQTIFEVVLPRGQFTEEFEFSNIASLNCAAGQPASYYRYSAALQSPFKLQAGQKYWIAISAEMGRTGLLWGLRDGLTDNGLAQATGGGFLFIPADMAFALSGTQDQP